MLTIGRVEDLEAVEPGILTIGVEVDDSEPGMLTWTESPPFNSVSDAGWVSDSSVLAAVPLSGDGVSGALCAGEPKCRWGKEPRGWKVPRGANPPRAMAGQH